MGICKLPAKEDYFPGNRSDILPQHHSAIHLSTKSMFDYLWCNFHVSFAPNDEEFLEPEPTEPEEELQEEVMIELIHDMIVLEDMDMDIDDEEEKQQETQQEEEDEQQTPPPHQAWYSTVTSVINHVKNRVLQKLCKHPGWQVAIDEMLQKFKGKSAEIYRTKKPDKEGFKFFAMCCTITGFSIYNFIPPDGRLNREKNKILKAVEYLLSTLPRRKSLKYLLGMDNYFTQLVVVSMTRGLNVGLVGTARRQRGWPPQEYKDVGATTLCIRFLGVRKMIKSTC
jgi:hypothetical protein